MPGTCAAAAIGISASIPASKLAFVMPTPPLRLFGPFYHSFRASNPVVSDEGKYMAFQMGRSGRRAQNPPAGQVPKRLKSRHPATHLDGRSAIN